MRVRRAKGGERLSNAKEEIIASHKTSSDHDIVDKTWILAGRDWSKEIKPEANNDIIFSRSLESMLSSRSDLIQVGSTFIEMVNPPEISGRIRTKLHISSEIERRSTEDRPFNYILNNTFNIIDLFIGNPGFHYRINANLRDKGNIYGWERVDIIIKFPDEHYDEIDGYWKGISTKVSEFYNSLQNNPTFSEDTINRLRKFIYIVIRAEE